MNTYEIIKPIKYPADFYLNSPEKLYSKAEKYFKSVEKANKTARQRIPLSHSGFAKFLGISYDTWQENQRDLQAYADFMDTLRIISTRIHADQITGALSFMYPEDLLDETYWAWHQKREEKINQSNQSLN